jgi:phage terminase large subunit GpA-like protein
MNLKINFRNLHPTLAEILKLTLNSVAPREILSVPEWADRNVMFPDNSAKKGAWRTDDYEFWREPMENINNPKVLYMSLMTCAQIGKTTLGIIDASYLIKHMPSPLMYLLPTIHMAESFSRDKFEPMTNNIDEVHEILGDRVSRNSNNTILQKTYPGGFIKFAGGNSPTDLAQHSVRVTICDDIDRIPASAGDEGDPVFLAEQRTESYTFFNRKMIRMSTPTVEQTSRIYRFYMQGDQREFYVACPHCGHYQTLKWDRLHWEEIKNLAGEVIDFNAENNYYECENKECGSHLKEADKRWMISAKGKGKWIPKRPEIKDHRSYKINRLYSPLSSWASVIREYYTLKDDTASQRIFQNTVLGEPWKDGSTVEVEIADLMKRNEDYLTEKRKTIPNGVLLITAQVDVQADRLEMKLSGWGRKKELWTLFYTKFTGDPEQLEVYEEAAEFLKAGHMRDDKVTIHPAICLVDIGYKQNAVLAGIERMKKIVHLPKGIIGIKGGHGDRAIIPNKISFTTKKRYVYYTIGVDRAKDAAMDRLKTPKSEDPAPDAVNPNYHHFTSSCCDINYFEQLTAERKEIKWSAAYGPQAKWVKKKEGIRNEVWDLEVYGVAAEILCYADYDRLYEKYLAEAKELEGLKKAPATFMHEDVAEEPEKKQVNKPKPRRIYGAQTYNPLKIGGNFVESWRK